MSVNCISPAYIQGVTGNDLLAHMKGMEMRRDYYDPSSVIGSMEDGWDFYAILPQGRNKVEEDPIDVESFDERLELERENCKAFSIKRLKKELEELGVEYTGFCEKSEFVSALAEARVSGRDGDAKFQLEPREMFMWAVHRRSGDVTLQVIKNRFYHNDLPPEITTNSSRMAREALAEFDRLKAEGGIVPQEENRREGGMFEDPLSGLAFKPSKLASKPFFHDDDRMFRGLIDYGSDGKTEWQEVPAAGGGNDLNVLFRENKMTPELKRIVVRSSKEDDKHSWDTFYKIVHHNLSAGRCAGKLIIHESCDLTIPLHNGSLHSGDWFIYALGDTNIVTFFAVENEHGHYVAQMGPMPVEEKAKNNAHSEGEGETGKEEAADDEGTEKDTAD